MMRSLLLALPLLAAGSPARAPEPVQTTEFARLVARLSEPGGYFDSDNLISNETSYLHVSGALTALGVRGGAYLGVGPEQNFSYIARIRPEVAILVDIRRDNMLLHLLFKAMFSVARNRMEYLCLLFGRPVPAELPMWTDLPVDQLLDYLDQRPADPGLHEQNHAMLMERVTRYGVPLDSTDRATLRRFHDEFAGSGTELRYTSRGRPPRFGYPTVGQLYAATDLDGTQASYLATEDAFRVVRELERRDRIIPVVGDLSGEVAMPAIARYLRERKLEVRAFYVSNVEMYLFRQGSFPRYAENVRALPTGKDSYIIRSYFGRGRFGFDGVQDLPRVLPGQLSAQILQPVSAFLEAAFPADSATYGGILMRGAIELQGAARPRRRRGRPVVRRLARCA